MENINQSGIELANDSSLLHGTVTELLPTLPFDFFSYLKKEYIDEEEGIDEVTISCAFSRINEPVDWNNIKSFIMMPEWGTTPLRRSWIVRVPTYYKGSDKFLFHYYFQIKYADGKEILSENYTQLITAREFEYIDHTSSLTNITLHWSLNDWSYPQDTPMEAEGIDWEDECSISRSPYKAGDKLYREARRLKIEKLPHPRRFKTIIAVPSKETVNYCFKLEGYKEGEPFTKWDNNEGKNFLVRL